MGSLSLTEGEVGLYLKQTTTTALNRSAPLPNNEVGQGRYVFFLSARNSRNYVSSPTQITHTGDTNLARQRRFVQRDK